MSNPQTLPDTDSAIFSPESAFGPMRFAALRCAGWPDSRAVWTGSCPCQPFSAAGQGLGIADERHLWPAWFYLVGQHEPAAIFGEQVASKDANPWVDLVHDDLEALGYAFGAVPFPAAGVGAPHIRDRLYWVAHALRARRAKRWAIAGHGQATGGRCAGVVGDSHDARLERWKQPERERTSELFTWAAGMVSRLADPDSERQFGVDALLHRDESGWIAQNCAKAPGRSEALRRPGPVNGFWSSADWLLCRDEKWRAVEPGAFPLADGDTRRVGCVRAYGNAINAEAAIAFIESYLESEAA